MSRKHKVAGKDFTFKMNMNTGAGLNPYGTMKFGFDNTSELNLKGS